jgi:hypothetical protein
MYLSPLPKNGIVPSILEFQRLLRPKLKLAKRGLKVVNFWNPCLKPVQSVQPPNGRRYRVERGLWSVWLCCCRRMARGNRCGAHNFTWFSGSSAPVSVCGVDRMQYAYGAPFVKQSSLNYFYLSIYLSIWLCCSTTGHNSYIFPKREVLYHYCGCCQALIFETSVRLCHCQCQCRQWQTVDTGDDFDLQPNFQIGSWYIFFWSSSIPPIWLILIHTIKHLPQHSCSSHNLLSKGEHNVPGHFVYIAPLTRSWRYYSHDCHCFAIQCTVYLSHHALLCVQSSFPTA